MSLTIHPIMTTTLKKPSMTPRASKAEWPVPAGLIALTAIPVLAGIVRLIGLASGVAVTPANTRFVTAPIPVTIHILSVTIFCFLGAFQFVPGFRRRRPGWHRAAGRLLMVCGLAAGLSGLWMTQFYLLPPALQGSLLYGFRLLIGTVMVLSIARSWRAILHRDIAQHRTWLIRAYAIGQGAGTQALILMLYAMRFGDARGLSYDLLMILAWVINLAVAEWIIRRQPAMPSLPILTVGVGTP
jgi:uncharacterized membrane protein